jgi:NOL1/NOP2/fmu family ribosome biogenesis protein
MDERGFPEGWIEQLRPLLGDQLPDFLHALNGAPLRGIRTRQGIAPPPEAGERIPWGLNAFYLPLDSEAGARPAHEAGAYYIQEPSAMIPAAALRPHPGDRVLDLCAAPAAKAPNWRPCWQGKGCWCATSRAWPRPGAFPEPGTDGREKRRGRQRPAGGAEPRWPEFFDKILGRPLLRGRHVPPPSRDPEEWTAASPAGCAGRQAHILRHAAMMLRPGGRLAYSTCTFNATENEGIIEGFLKEHPDFHLAPFSLPGLPTCGGMLRVWPHLVRGEGHFAALLERDGDAPKKQAGFGLPAPGKQESALTRAFLQEHIAEKITPNAVFAGKLCAVPEELPPLKGVRVLRLGLQIGEAKGKIFLPDHALALACPSLRTVPVTEDQARLYQAGQVLPVDEDLQGFYTPALDGLNLGWGKASDGQLKNHYPKGLRKSAETRQGASSAP